jgi:hypothetical protein
MHNKSARPYQGLGEEGPQERGELDVVVEREVVHQRPVAHARK